MTCQHIERRLECSCSCGSLGPRLVPVGHVCTHTRVIEILPAKHICSTSHRSARTFHLVHRQIRHHVALHRMHRMMRATMQPWVSVVIGALLDDTHPPTGLLCTATHGKSGCVEPFRLAASAGLREQHRMFVHGVPSCVGGVEKHRLWPRRRPTRQKQRKAVLPQVPTRHAKHTAPSVVFQLQTAPKRSGSCDTITPPAPPPPASCISLSKAGWYRHIPKQPHV